MVRFEEERFGSTVVVGLQKLDELFEKTGRGKLPSYLELARLYDTFGTPRDLIRVALEERGFSIEEEEFLKSFDAALKDIQDGPQREKTVGEGAPGTDAIIVVKAETYAPILVRVGKAVFTGYEGTQVADARIVALVRGDEELPELKKSEEGGVVLDRTPFYAESGGQVRDVGRLAKPPATA